EFGGSAEDASKLRFALEETGVSFESGEKGIAKFAKAIAGIADLEDGVNIKTGKEMTANLKAMGVAVEDAHGKMQPMNVILGEVANKFKTLPDGAEKTALATQLFGRAGRDLIPFLNRGADGIKALGDAATKLGLVIDDKILVSLKEQKE